MCGCEIGTGQSQPLNGMGKKGGLLLAKGIERQATLNIQSTEMEMAIYAGHPHLSERCITDSYEG